MRTPVPDFTGVVLAGGRSRRFGSDKARHILDGRPMIEHVARAVSEVCDTVLVSHGSENPPYELPNVRYVRDHFVDAGPLAGVHAAMLATATPWLLVVACDMPFVTADALQRLLDHRRPEIQAVISRDGGGRLQPLCACYRRDLLKPLSDYLDGGRRSARGFIGGIECAVAPFEDEAVFKNVNTPEDLSSHRAHDEPM